MSSEAKAVLQTLSFGELKKLAADYLVETKGWKGKPAFVAKLADVREIEMALASVPYRVRAMLTPKSVPAIKKLAGELGVDVAGGKNKADLVARIAASPAAEKLLARPTASASVTPPPPTPPPPRPDMGNALADPVIFQGRNQDVDFGLVEDVLDQARMRFEERNFDRTLELSREALLLARGTEEAFERAAWAYALLAAQRLIDESGRVGRDVEPAVGMLRDAKTAYLSGNLRANEELLMKLQSATKALYSEDVRRLRAAMYAARDLIAQSAHVGADVTAAEEALAHARDAMDRGDHTRARQLVEETNRLNDEALQRRVKEIEGEIPVAHRAIEEARHVGADVDEAARLLDKAKVAMARREYVLAAELVQRAERSTLEGQHRQIQKAMELRMRQIEKAQRIVNYLVPVIDEAAGYDLPIDQARRWLADARSALDQGDYVNGTSFAKQAQDELFALIPKMLEGRARAGIVKPTAGRCAACGSPDVLFMDDGWSRCNACGAEWRWRTPSGLWERFRSLLRE